MLLEKTYTFNIKTESRVFGKTLEGTFTLRRATLADLGAISAGVSRLNQGEPFSAPQFQILFLAIATVAVCGEDVPEWWKEVTEESAADTAVMLHIWSKLVEAREKGLPFRPSEPQKAEAAIGAALP